MATALEKFRDVFNRLDKESTRLIHEIYTPEIHFRDPVHEIHGINELEKYFAGLYDGVESCQFEFGEATEHEGVAYQPWTMRLVHPSLHKRSNPAVVPGISHLKIKGDKISYHGDYFDMGAMIYEHVPVVGFVVRKIKGRL